MWTTASWRGTPASSWTRGTPSPAAAGRAYERRRHRHGVRGARGRGVSRRDGQRCDLRRRRRAQDRAAAPEPAADLRARARAVGDAQPARWPPPVHDRRARSDRAFGYRLHRGRDPARRGRLCRPAARAGRGPGHRAAHESLEDRRHQEYRSRLHVGADVTHVRKGIGTDRRIGSAFLFPGPGYGGSCFPKDVKALLRTAATKAVSLDVLAAVELANDRQKRVLFEKLQRHFDGDLEGETFAIWGLAFKAETDDVRESPALVLVEELLCAGAKVRVHDPAALETARRQLGDRVTYAAQAYDALQGAAALAIVTEWLEYRNPDFARIRQLLSRRLIVDGRNLYDPSRLARLGLTYDSIGRRLACASS